MVIGTCRMRLSADWANSLKDKRMIVKSIIDKTKRKFNVSIAETELQDAHREIVIGFACVTNEAAHADSTIQHVLNFIENSTDAVVCDVRTEILHI